MSTAGWHLVTVEHEGHTRAGILTDGQVYLPEVLAECAGAIDVVREWDRYTSDLAAWVPGAPVEAHVVMPLAYPAKVLCSGPNFTDHLAEMGESGLGEQWTGYFFFKPPTTTMIGDGDPVRVADVERDRVDYEGELAVVLGRGGRDIDRSVALEHVAGYLTANDISLRRPHHRDTPARPFEWDWIASKAADDSLPIGPGVRPAWQVPEPQTLRIVTRVNGEVRQDGSTANMVIDVAGLIADASRLVTLEAGDVILTGTPAGVAAGSGRFLATGDVVEVEITGVGTITNTIEARGADSADGSTP